ncbi:unnamed protein product [Ectocarpus sp. 12 AP-2014]
MSSASCFGTLFRPVQHPMTSALLCVILVLSAAAGLGWRHSLSLIWNHTFMTQFYFWNVLTGSFVETSVFKLVASLIGVAGLGPAAEDSLGHLGLGAFVLCVGLVSGFVTSCGIFMGYIITRQEYLLDLELHGSFGVLAALAVAAAQQDASATLLPAGRAPWFPTRYLPLSLVTASAVCRAFSVPVVAKDFPFVVVGAYASWVYLRFFAHLVLGAPSGDVTEDFQLVNFFPLPCRRVVKPMCDFTYGVFLLLGCFKGRAARLPVSVVDGQGGVDPLVVATLPTPARKDPIAERRRARAMKLLDEKFATLNAKPANRWDDDEGWEAEKGAGSTAAAIGLAPRKPALAPSAKDASVPQARAGGPIGAGGAEDDDDWGMAGGEDEEDDDGGVGDADEGEVKSAVPPSKSSR